MVPFPFSRYGKSARGKRKSFQPVPIIKKGRALSDFSAAFLALAVLGSTIIVALQIYRYSGLPAPRVIPGFSSIGWAWLEKENEAVRPGSLPNYAQAVAHAAFLESFEYGRSYGIPQRDEQVQAREYVKDPATAQIHERSVTVKAFDSAWLNAVAAHAPAGSIERMLLDQIGPVSVSAAGSSRRFFTEALFAFFCICILAFGLSGAFRGGPLISGDFWSSNFKSRKKRRMR
jgi:hypothetical protein